jgi:predicted phosphoribosyltransferase
VALLGGETERASFPPAYLNSLIALKRTELEARARDYRHGQPPISLAGRTAILVDDGLAEPVVVQAAVRAIRKAGASQVVFAAATCGGCLRRAVEGEVEHVVALDETEDLWNAPICDEGFAQTTASEVGELIHHARASAAFRSDALEPLSDRRMVDRRRHRPRPAGMG